MKPAAHEVTNSINQRGKFQPRSPLTYGIAEPEAAQIRISANTIRFTVLANSLRLKSVSMFISLFGHVMSAFSFNAHT
jgi:hypothetical protein